MATVSFQNTNNNFAHPQLLRQGNIQQAVAIPQQPITTPLDSTIMFAWLATTIFAWFQIKRYRRKRNRGNNKNL